MDTSAIAAGNIWKRHWFAGIYNHIVCYFNGGMPLLIELITSADVLPRSGLGSSSTMIVTELEASLVLFSTGIVHNSSAVVDSQIANVAGGDTRCLETTMALKQDTADMKAALLCDDMSSFSHIQGQGWESKKRTSNATSSSMFGNIYDTTCASCALADKVSGVGGCGFMTFMVEPEHHADVVRASKIKKRQALSCVFSDHSTEGWRV